MVYIVCWLMEQTGISKLCDGFVEGLLCLILYGLSIFGLILCLFFR